MRKILVLLSAGSLLCACGQKGNLYLPDDNKEEVQPASSPTASPAAAPAATPAVTGTPDENDPNSARRNRSNSN